MKSKISIKQKLFLILAIVVSSICLSWLATSLIYNALAEENQANEANALPNVTYEINPEQCVSYCDIAWSRTGTGDYFKLLYDDGVNFNLDVMTSNDDNYGQINVRKTAAAAAGWEFQGIYINNAPIVYGQVINSDCTLEARFSKDPSAPANVKFTHHGVVDPGVVPEYSLDKDGFTIPYNIGDPVQVNKGATVEIISCEYNGAAINIDDGDTTYGFMLYAPYGYDLVSVTPEKSIIDNDTTFVYTLQKYSGDYHLDISTNFDSAPIKDFKFIVRDKDWNIIAEKYTDDSGNWKLDLTNDQANCTIEGEKEGYSDLMIVVDASFYDPNNNHTYTEEFSVDPDTKANTRLRSSDPSHKYFELQLKATLVSDPTYILMERSMKKPSITTTLEGVVGEFVVQPDGTLHCEEEQSGVLIMINIIPVSEGDIPFDHWSIDLGDGVVKDYRVGDTFNFDPSPPQYNKIFGYVFYGNNPEPTPAEEVNASAQTGDSAPLVPFVLLAVLASGVLLYTRKALQK